jgi:diguanylate cyclase (GGDEF)-like protein
MMDSAQKLRSLYKKIRTGTADDQDRARMDEFIENTILLTGAVKDSNGSHFWQDNLFNFIHALGEVSKGLDIDQIANLTCLHVAQLLGADGCAIIQREFDLNEYALWAFHADLRWKQANDFQRLNFNESNLIQKTFLRDEVFQIRIESDLNGDEKSWLGACRIKSILFLPLAFKGILHAYVLILSLDPRQFGEQEIAIAQLLIRQAAASIENANLFNRAKRHTKELEAIYNASLSLTASLELPDVLNAILKSTLGIMKAAQDAHIFLYDQEKLIFGAVLWADGRSNKLWAEPRKDGLTYTVARKGEMIMVEDMDTHTLFLDKPKEWHGSIIGLPLKIGQRVVGVMTVAFDRPRKFVESETRVLRLMADQAALAIENARLHNLIRQQAFTDFLTNLPNRRSFDSRLETEIRRSNRYQRPFTLVMIDLDRFKAINDQFGHPFGDDVLKRTAGIMSKSVRDTDFLARYGGDEFALILPETERIEATEVIKRLQIDLENSRITLPNGESAVISLCAGMAVCPRKDLTAANLVKKADEALYANKKKKLGYS